MPNGYLESNRQSDPRFDMERELRGSHGMSGAGTFVPRVLHSIAGEAAENGEPAF